MVCSHGRFCGLGSRASSLCGVAWPQTPWLLGLIGGKLGSVLLA